MLKASKFISSPATPWRKYVYPGAFLVAGLVRLRFGQVELGVVPTLIAVALFFVFRCVHRVERSMGRIRVHRRGEDVWIDYSDVDSIGHRDLVRGYEAAVLHLNRETALGRRIWFLLERRYLFGGPLLKNRPVHPTISSTRTLCKEARSR